MAQGGMNLPVQARSQQTRARLIAVAQALIAEQGFGALRIDEVVQRAGVAKGTFFAHFRDKDALMEQLIAARIDAHLDALAAAPVPRTPADLVAALLPLMGFMTSERYVFDVILRHSGAAARSDIGPIATTFDRTVALLAAQIARAGFRPDADPALLAEGVQAFMVHAMALDFCALHRDAPLADRLAPMVALWLAPAAGNTPDKA